MSTPALQDRPVSKTQIFCSNLPWSVNGKMLRQAFEEYGEVIDAFVAYNGRSSRGFGYVTFKEPAHAKAAVEAMNAEGFVHTWPGAPISEDDKTRETRVEMARERPKPRPEPRAHGDRRDGDGDRRRDSDGRGRGRGRNDGESRGRGKGGDGDGEGGKGARRSGRGRGEGGGRGRGRGRVDQAVSAAALMDSLTMADSSAEPTTPGVEDSSEA